MNLQLYQRLLEENQGTTIPLHENTIEAKMQGLQNLRAYCQPQKLEPSDTQSLKKEIARVTKTKTIKIERRK